MTHIDYVTKGTCSRGIHIDIEGDRIYSVQFDGGCPGNTSGISRLTAGMKVKDVIEKLEGVVCRDKSTSCPDQLARALKEALSSGQIQ